MKCSDRKIDVALSSNGPVSDNDEFKRPPKTQRERLGITKLEAGLILVVGALALVYVLIMVVGITLAIIGIIDQICP